MSNYLSSRLDAESVISIEYRSDVIAVRGTDKVHAVALRNSRDGTDREITAWLYSS
jgi:hypothetical protein